MSSGKNLIAGLTLVFFLSTSNALGQSAAAQQERSPLDATNWGVVYDITATAQVKVRPDVPYLKDARGALTLDIYSPPDMKAGQRLPAVVFINAIGDRPGNRVKDWAIYKSWPRLVAAHGLIGISMDADGERIQESLRGVFDFLTKHGSEHGIDGTRLGIYAASANVRGASQYLTSEFAAKGIRAAALYYGGVPQGRLRTDLATLFIVAAGDAPGLGAPLAALWQRIIETGAPWTLMFASDMPHGFDAFTDTDDARRIIQQTIAFWKSNLEPVPAPSWQPSEAREIVAATYGNDFQKTADLLAPWIKENPKDANAYIHYGRALQRLGRLDEAASAFERAIALGSDHPGAVFGLGQVKFSAGKYEEAAQFLSRAIDRGARNSVAYTQLANSQLHIGRNEEAVKNYERALEIGIPSGANTRGIAYYNLACGYARVGQKDRALDALSNAVAEGFTDRNAYETDADLAPLRSEPRFREILSRLPRQ